MINMSLIAHPLNWLTIAVWLFAIAFLAHHAMNTTAVPSGATPGSSSTLG